MPTTVWVATADIRIGSGASFVLAYTPGNRVPASVVTSLGLEASGLVQSATINDDGTSPNWRGADPITRSELDEAVADALADGPGGGSSTLAAYGDPSVLPDGPVPATLTSGQAALNFGSQPFAVSGGRYTHASGASYLQVDLGERVGRVGFDFVVPEDGNGVAAIVVPSQRWDDGTFNEAAVHFTITRTTWGISYWMNPGEDHYASGTFFNPLPVGTHRVELALDGPDCHMILPGGLVRTVTDSRLNDFVSTWAIWELYSPGADPVPLEIARVWADGVTPSFTADVTMADLVRGLNAGTDQADPDALVRRTSDGSANFKDLNVFGNVVMALGATQPYHAVTKAYADNLGTSSVEGDTVVRRDSVGATAMAAVYLNAAPQFPDSATRKDYADAGDTAAKARTNHTGTQAAATISDLTETVQDIVGALIVAGTNTTVTYNDAAGTFTINATASGGTTDPEIVRDTIGGALVAGSGVQITVNDAGDTITVASTAVLPARQIISGTGLTGGGDLSADRTLAVSYGTIAGTAVQGNDTRVTADQAAATASIRTLGSGAAQAKPGNYQPTAANISDSTATGRAVVTATDAAAARSAIGAGRVDSTDGTVLNIVAITAAAYAALGTKVATTLYVLVG